MKDAKVDRYIEQAGEFAQPVLHHLRQMVHLACPDVDETIKWSRPFFVDHGTIVANMAVFKAHCSFGFWGPGMHEVLRLEGMDRDDAGGSLGRLTCVEDLPADSVLLHWLKMAFQIAGERTGEANSSAAPPSKERRRPKMSQEELAIPPDLAAALALAPGATERFTKFSPSCRREYVQWIDEAKRSETRTKRVATTAQWVSEGKQRNWKHQSPLAVEAQKAENSRKVPT